MSKKSRNGNKHVNNIKPDSQPKQHPDRMVWLAVPRERASLDVANDSICKVMLVAGRLGYGLLSLPYMRTDQARNQYAKRFLEVTSENGRIPNPRDTLIMMDNDHKFEPDIAFQLAERISDKEGRGSVAEGARVGVVGALAFKRGEPYEPCFFKRGTDGELHSLAEWEPAMYEGEVIGHAAVAIARWVFDELEAQGKQKPYWRYTYKDGSWEMPSEDMYFSRVCEDSGISHWVDTSLEAPHLILSQVDSEIWGRYLEQNQEILRPEGLTIPTLLVPESAGNE